MTARQSRIWNTALWVFMVVAAENLPARFLPDHLQNARLAIPWT